MKTTIKKIYGLSIFILIASSFLDFSYAQSVEYPCINKALTVKEVVTCGNEIVFPLEADIEREFKRLRSKYEDNKEMQQMLDLTRSSWDNFRNIQCRTEELAADNGQLVNPRTIEAEKAFLRCVIRKLKEMKNDLSKL